ncbi:glycosyltransferase [Methanolobus sp. WCC4]|uniref:glycosyltransferase n=1 Tax=Methanolobus sp. WCC4 TaxID=3125784 RepID=UPI0030F68B25
MVLSEKQGVSVYCTVLNEESSIKALLESLLSQTRLPDEIVIVDGGSTDRTIDVIHDYTQKYPIIRLFIEKNANVAQGRNMAIANTSYDIIVSIDAGCIADRFWLENIIEYFDSSVDIVAGVCVPDGKTLFEICSGEVLYPSVDEFKADWPSHQNLAFRKHVWTKIKYPEKCYRSEDSWFNLRLRENGFKCKLAKNSVVYWRPRKNFREVFNNSYMWAKSNIENDVRASKTRQLAQLGSRKLIWNSSSLLAFFVVFVFFSKVGAIILFPFILKPMINTYPGEKNISKIIYKNTIYYTHILAYSLGYRDGQKIVKRRLKAESGKR